jgi:hypothetical protein
MTATQMQTVCPPIAFTDYQGCRHHFDALCIACVSDYTVNWLSYC